MAGARANGGMRRCVYVCRPGGAACWAMTTDVLGGRGGTQDPCKESIELG